MMLTLADAVISGDAVLNDLIIAFFVVIFIGLFHLIFGHVWPRP